MAIAPTVIVKINLEVKVTAIIPLLRVQLIHHALKIKMLNPHTKNHMDLNLLGANVHNGVVHVLQGLPLVKTDLNVTLN
jgi:hypothetical protein